MAKGEYEFPTLVTCLLILALQIHNPFQRAQQNSCQCNGNTPASPAAGFADASARPTSRASDTAPPSSSPSPAPPRASPDPAPVYRRPREVSPAAPTPGGMSTDALLRELDSIQAKAREQQDTLAAAGRMPPPSPILQQLKEIESAEDGAPVGGGMPMAQPPAASWGGSPNQVAGGAPPSGSAVMPPAPASGGLASSQGMGMAPLLRRRDDFGRFLEARQPRGLGIVLGVGRGDFALRLLADWASSQGIYLVDPYIHIWQGYDDPSNLSDREHQLIFEELRNRLAVYEGRYVLVRDFSHSFAETYRSGGSSPGLPTFVYIDANHAEKAVERDLNLWWPLLAPGGVLAGSTYVNDATGRVRVQAVVDRFVARQHLNLYLTHDDAPPSWFIFKE